MKTYAPSDTNRFAVAKPIPLLPPVTTANSSRCLPNLCVRGDKNRKRVLGKKFPQKGVV